MSLLTVFSLLFYLFCAVLGRDSFHTVWSLTFLGLFFLAAHILDQPSGGYTVVLPSITLLALVYALWAVLRSDSTFHRASSLLAIAFIPIIKVVIVDLPFGPYGVLLSILALVNLTICAGLSPLFLPFVQRSEKIDVNHGYLKVLSHGDSGGEDTGGCQKTACVEYVTLPEFYVGS